MPSSTAIDDGRPVGEDDLVVIAADARPDLWERAETSFRSVWPEYNMHGDVSGDHFAALFEDRFLA